LKKEGAVGSFKTGSPFVLEITRYRGYMNELSAAVNAIETRDPQVRQVLRYPNSTLTTPSAPVIPGGNLTPKALKELLDDMVATLLAYNAVGLAAVQIGVPLQILVVRDEKSGPVKVINPRLVSASGHSYEIEGCLSFPGVFFRVARPADVVIEYFDENLVKQTTGCNGLLGRAIQHEMDHLKGETFLDRLSNLERQNVLRKMKHRARKVKALAASLTRRGR
jgi:peptide deformylase